jgi:hypothetical protein
MYANMRVVESRFAWPTTCVKGRFLLSFHSFRFLFSLVIFTISFIICCLTNPSVLGYLIITKIIEKRLCPKHPLCGRNFSTSDSLDQALSAFGMLPSETVG